MFGVGNRSESLATASRADGDDQEEALRRAPSRRLARRAQGFRARSPLVKSLQSRLFSPAVFRRSEPRWRADDSNIKAGGFSPGVSRSGTTLRRGLTHTYLAPRARTLAKQHSDGTKFFPHNDTTIGCVEKEEEVRSTIAMFESED